MKTLIVLIKQFPFVGNIYCKLAEIIGEKQLNQIIRFLIIGFAIFIIDASLLWLLTEAIGIKYLLSSAISFVISTCINYYLSMTFVFQGREGRDKKNELLVFALLNLIGLGLTTLFMWIFVDKAMLYLLIAKVFTTAIVMVWSFVSRKVFLERR